MSIATEALAAWSLGPAPADFDLVHVRAVTPDAVLDDARIVVRDGRIAAVDTGVSQGARSVDGGGLLVIPGVIDSHSDAVERERMPRPNAEVPLEFALTSLEGRLAGAGITTIFHGAAFQHQNTRGVARSVEMARELCDAIDAFASYRVDHRILHRLDVLSAGGAEALRQRLAQGSADGVPALVSHEDHTPGQGQYADPEYLVNYIVHNDGRSVEAARAQVERLKRTGEEEAHVRTANLAWLGEEAKRGTIILAGHDPDTADGIDELVERGGHVAEFPTTVVAARRAREHGLDIIAGAPNLLRGRSHSGNVSAEELLREGLLDALSSDYLPNSLLGSVWRCVREGLTSLPAGIALITSGPARATGLTDRGRLAEGLRADLAVVDDSLGDWPRVVATLRAGVRA